MKSIKRAHMKLCKRSLVAAAALMLAGQAAVATSAPTQWTTAAGGNGHWYEVVVGPAGVTWEQALSAANAAGGYLATITSAAENAFAFSLANARPDAWEAFNDQFGQLRGPWLGGFQPAGSSEPFGGWTWTNGEGAFGFTAWQSASPNNVGGNEYALEFYGLFNTRESRWNDNSGSFPNKSYVIEWSTTPVPEPGAWAMLLAGLGALGLWSRRRQA